MYLTITFIHDLDLRLECSVSGGWGVGGELGVGAAKMRCGEHFRSSTESGERGGQGGVTLQLHSGGWSLFYPL